MSGIPVYTTTNPQTASKATDGTPKTTPPSGIDNQQSPRDHGDSAAPATITDPTQTSRYPAAQPGAAPVTAPTQTPQPLHPTPTATISLPTAASGPPPPLPGAVPTISRSAGQEFSVPPPPKVGEVVKPAEFYAPAPTKAPVPSAQPGLPPQQTEPPQWSHQLSTPVRAQPPGATTSSALERGRRSLDHPPGYMQNPNATADNVVNPPIRPLEGLGARGQDSSLDDEPSAWDTAKNWAMNAAGKVGEIEKEVWRRINGEEK